MRPVELGREETRRRLKDLIRPAQLGDLPLEPLQVRRLLTRRTGSGTDVDLGLADPRAQRLGRPDPQPTCAASRSSRSPAWPRSTASRPTPTRTDPATP